MYVASNTVSIANGVGNAWATTTRRCITVTCSSTYGYINNQTGAGVGCAITLSGNNVANVNTVGTLTAGNPPNTPNNYKCCWTPTSSLGSGTYVLSASAWCMQASVVNSASPVTITTVTSRRLLSSSKHVRPVVKLTASISDE